LELIGFDQHEIDRFLADVSLEDRANEAPPSRMIRSRGPGDLWPAANT
jgi:hypothetical protein